MMEGLWTRGTNAQCAAIPSINWPSTSLADCYTALHEIERAAECYLQAQRFLLRCDEQLPPTDKALQAMQHANTHLHALWCELLCKHKDDVPYASRLDYHNNSKLLQQESVVWEPLDGSATTPQILH